MDIQDALASIAVYNSMTTYPLLAVKGLSIYLQEEKTVEQKERMNIYLREFSNQFADVIIGFHEGKKEVMQVNVTVYDGILALSKRHPEIVQDVTTKVLDLKAGISRILLGEKPSSETVKTYINNAIRIVDLSEETISGRAYENYLFGNPATIS